MDAETSLQKTGFIRCQIRISELVMAHHRELFVKLMDLKKEIDQMPGMLQRKEKINEYLLLSGESKALSWISEKISSLSSEERGKA